MYNFIKIYDYIDRKLNLDKNYEKGKCYFKIDYDRDSIGDTYSTLSNSFLNSGGIISDSEYCVDSSVDFYDYYEEK